LAKRINARLVAERRVDQPDIAAFEVAPVAPGFEAERLITGLPAVADLTAGGAAGVRVPLVPKCFEKTRAPAPFGHFYTAARPQMVFQARTK
jgi:hypothetical protein